MRHWVVLLIVGTHFIRDIVAAVEEEIRRPYEKRFAGGSGITSLDDDFHGCSSHFEIRENEIIRTQDSRKLGAKYINEKDVGSREECLRLCCETEGCNVFVFDESSPGSCYMFDCGTPDDFKCKFTTHQKYTSAISRQLTELEHQIKFTQHEHELTRLREPQKLNGTKEIASTTSPQNKEALAYAFGSSDIHSKKGCSRYQFECHKSGECIAIYNVCDGIPQCSDNSDEAPEGCLSKTTTSTPFPASRPEPKGPEAISNVEGQMEPSSSYHWPSNARYVNEGSPQLQSFQTPQQNPNNVVQPRANYGREGEGLANYREQESQWSSQQQFHPGNGLMPQTAERYPQQRPYSVDVPQRPFNERLPVDYSKYYSENGAYRPVGMQNSQNVNWQQVGHRDIASAQGEAEVPVNRPDYPPNNLPADYYYEEYRSRNQPYNNLPGNYQQPQIPQQNNPQTINRIVYTQSRKDPSAGTGSNVDEPPLKHESAPTVVIAAAVTPVRASTTAAVPQTSTTVTPKVKAKPKESATDHVGHSNRKVDKLTAESKLSESFLSDDIEPHNSNPSGAILSLVMGLSVTTIMIVLVGCRMRMVRKRIRRGGKYAHDADFLVNGMYL